MTHTKGPWRIGDAGATVFGPPQGLPPLIVANVRSKANAHLIAAAPDLLEAAKHLLKDLEQDFELTANEIQSAYVLRYAIAKAEGRE